MSKEENIGIVPEKEIETFQNVSEYESSVNNLIQDISEENIGIREITEKMEEKEKLETLDHSVACLFNYFETKDKNKIRVKNLKNILEQRMETDFKTPLNWQGKQFTNIDLEGVEFKGRETSKPNLRDTKFEGKESNLKNTKFNNIDLHEACFKNIQKSRYMEFNLNQPTGKIYIEGCNMRGTTFSGKKDVKNLESLTIKNSKLNSAEINLNARYFNILGENNMRNTTLAGRIIYFHVENYESVDLSGTDCSNMIIVQNPRDNLTNLQQACKKDSLGDIGTQKNNTI